jgi:hypothetical protein
MKIWFKEVPIKNNQYYSLGRYSLQIFNDCTLTPKDIWFGLSIFEVDWQNLGKEDNFFSAFKDWGREHPMFGLYLCLKRASFKQEHIYFDGPNCAYWFGPFVFYNHWNHCEKCFQN